MEGTLCGLEPENGNKCSLPFWSINPVKRKVVPEAYIDITREEIIAISRIKHDQTFLKNMSWNVCVLNKDICQVYLEDSRCERRISLWYSNDNLSKRCSEKM